MRSEAREKHALERTLPRAFYEPSTGYKTRGALTPPPFPSGGRGEAAAGGGRLGPPDAAARARAVVRVRRQGGAGGAVPAVLPLVQGDAADIIYI